MTGKREIVIDYTSDSDALPIEHEEEHRQLAEQGGRRRARRTAKVEVSRERDGGGRGGGGEAEPVAQPTATKRYVARMALAISR